MNCTPMAFARSMLARIGLAGYLCIGAQILLFAGIAAGQEPPQNRTEQPCGSGILPRCGGNKEPNAESRLEGAPTEAATAAPPMPAMLGTAPSPWRLGIAIGYGERTNPLIASDDIPIVVDLDIAWFGERFFFDNGDFGFTFADNDAFTLSLVARINSDRVFFGRADTRFVTLDAGLSGTFEVPLEPPDRDYAVELGAELLTDGGWGRLQLAAFHDVSSTHDGYEVFAEWSRGFRQARWYVEPSLGAIYKSENLNDYYFGLRPDETPLPGLEAILGDGINLRARVAVSYQINPNWSATAAAEIERLNDDAASSPIVEDNHVLGYFAGVHYRF